MAIEDRGAINGDEINAWEVDGGVFVLDIDCDHAFALDQTLELVRIREMVVAHAFAFSQALELVRLKELAGNHAFAFDQTADAWRILELEIADKIIFDQFVVLDLLPSIAISMLIEFLQEAELDNTFFGHWFDGVRMNLPHENRTMLVPRDNRTIIVPPDDDELVGQKEREGVA